jgi:hypothetical protein
MTILENDRIYLFSQFMEFSQPPEEILAELGYTLHIESLSLPKADVEDSSVLQKSLERRIQLIPLTSEQARREALVAPILFEVVQILDLRLNIEYPIAGKRSKGNVDYLIRGREMLLVIEAKRDDLTRGFTQLAAEMIALGNCYGAVTTGNIWQFAYLQNQDIIQDFNLFRVPADLASLLAVLGGILS